MKPNIRHSLRATLWDGVCAAVTGGVTDQFVTPLAIALEATARQIAWLSSLPSLIGMGSQLASGWLRNRFGRRKVFMIAGVVVQTLCLYGLACLVAFGKHGRVAGIVLLMTLFSAGGAVSGPMWASLISKYLPLSRRSGYFGWRSRFLGGVTILATCAGGLILHYVGVHRLSGFVSILAVAATVRLMSWRFLGAMFEPKEPVAHGASYRHCLAVHRPFRQFIAAVGLMGFAVNVTGPFLALYMLRGLRLSYASYTALVVAAQVTMYWMMGRWGRNADRAGNIKIIQVTARFLPFTALFWIFSTNFLYLLAVQLISGVVWAGYNLCISNFVYDSVPQRARVHATALFNTVNGLAAFLGATLGGYLLVSLPAIGGYRYYSLLLIGAGLRALVGWILFPRLQEVRRVPKTRSKDLVYAVLMDVVPGKEIPAA